MFWFENIYTIGFYAIHPFKKKLGQTKEQSWWAIEDGEPDRPAARAGGNSRATTSDGGEAGLVIGETEESSQRLEMQIRIMGRRCPM